MISGKRQNRWARTAVLSLVFAVLGACAENDSPWVLTVTRVAGGLSSPTAMAVPEDGSGRMFITEQSGAVKIISAQGTVLSEPFLDLGSRLVTLTETYDESGLLGMVFHPQYSSNGRFFVFYTAAPGPETPEGYHADIRVSEFMVSPTSADRADPESEKILLEIPTPQSNHNGGQLAFGPDGFLYAGIGDGGNANDTGFGHTEETGNAQDLSSLLGKILRLDVSVSGAYTVPESNPFSDNASARPEIYAYGLRNPWRFSFDRGGDHRLFCGDVGQNLFEEINIIVGGANYGWNLREGLGCFDPDAPSAPPADCAELGYRGEPLVDPILVYAHPGAGETIMGRSVTGGYVYRGQSLSPLAGKFVFGDWSSSFLQPAGFALVAETTDNATRTLSRAALIDPVGRAVDRFLLSFGEDETGELYVLTSTGLGPGSEGEVFRITGARNVQNRLPGSQ